MASLSLVIGSWHHRDTHFSLFIHRLLHRLTVIQSMSPNCFILDLPFPPFWLLTQETARKFFPTYSPSNSESHILSNLHSFDSFDWCLKLLQSTSFEGVCSTISSSVSPNLLSSMKLQFFFRFRFWLLLMFLVLVFYLIKIVLSLLESCSHDFRLTI